MVPETVPTFSVQGRITDTAAGETGLAAGTPVTYRAGDQPNNALSLKVLNPGEVAATAGTSGVVYAVGDRADPDPASRVNIFVHVTHTADAPRYGVLMCLNGTGILNSWARHNLGGDAGKAADYERMNEVASRAPVGADGLLILPYGNGAERTLGNLDPGASIHGLRFNTHDRSHLLRAIQEGIVFALHHGLQIVREMGVEIGVIRAGRANMFLSPLFGRAFATVTGAVVELYNTDGAQGAARGAGLGAGIYENAAEAFGGLQTLQTIEPDGEAREAYAEAYGRWVETLQAQLSGG
jgi:xylulokinase